MDLNAFVRHSQKLFPDDTHPDHIVPILGVVVGDISRLLRGYGETGVLDRQELARELYNLSVTSARIAQEVAQDPVAAAQAAMDSQDAYVQARAGS